MELVKLCVNAVQLVCVVCVDASRIYSSRFLMSELLWIVGAAISCYVCNSREDLDGDKCAHISEKSHDLVYNCSNLPEDRGRSERDYTYCRKFIQDGKTVSSSL